MTPPGGALVGRLTSATRSSGAVANALDKLISLATAELASDKPRSYRLAPAVPAPAPAPCRVRVPVNNSAPYEH